MEASKGKKGPPDGPTKSKEEILAERKAKKAEKQAKKTGSAANANNEKKTAPPKGSADLAPTVVKEGTPDAYYDTCNFDMCLLFTLVVPPAPVVPAKTEDAAGGKSKAEQKAERRQKQEAQRAAKAEGGGKQAAPAKAPPTKRVPDQIQADRPSVVNRMVKRLAKQQV